MIEDNRKNLELINNNLLKNQQTIIDYNNEKKEREDKEKAKKIKKEANSHSEIKSYEEFSKNNNDCKNYNNYSYNEGIFLDIEKLIFLKENLSKGGFRK